MTAVNIVGPSGSTSETAVSGTDGRSLKICAAMKANVVIGSQRKNRVAVCTPELNTFAAVWPWIMPLKPPPASLVVNT